MAKIDQFLLSAWKIVKCIFKNVNFTQIKNQLMELLDHGDHELRTQCLCSTWSLILKRIALVFMHFPTFYETFIWKMQLKVFLIASCHRKHHVTCSHFSIVKKDCPIRHIIPNSACRFRWSGINAVKGRHRVPMADNNPKVTLAKSSVVIKISVTSNFRYEKSDFFSPNILTINEWLYIRCFCFSWISAFRPRRN